MVYYCFYDKTCTFSYLAVKYVVFCKSSHLKENIEISLRNELIYHWIETDKTTFLRNMSHSSIAGSMFVQRLRHCPNIYSTMDE